MHFMNKINYLKDNYKQLDENVRSHLIIRNERCPDEFLEMLQSNFPVLPISYMKFLKEYNGLKLDWISFRGAPQEKRTSIIDLLENWKEYYNLDLLKLNYCPIGEDAGADLYCLNEKGEVVMFDSEIYEDQEPRFIADSFESFMDECVLGKRYPEMSIEGSTFHQFLKEQGWA